MTSKKVVHIASLLLCVSGWMMPIAYAETGVAAAITTNTSAVTTTSVNAVQQFVQGDFDARSQLLLHWTGSTGELEQMLAALDAAELYTDDSGKVYRMKDGTTLTDYFTGQAISSSPPTLEEVSLNNALRTVIDTYKARTAISSSDVAVRLTAAKTFADDPTSIDDALLNERLKVETDANILIILNRIQSKKDLESGDAVRELRGAKAVSSSGDPEVKVLVDNKLADPTISPALKAALQSSQASIDRRLLVSEWGGHVFTGVSMGSILLLAALGLAITYGLLGVINMAHGELIMIGAYTTYVMQQFFNQHFVFMADGYLLAAIPAAFLVSAIVGMAIERIVIRPLYGRQLETLLATFGVSLILMQVVRMLFGAQNVEVANASWMSGGIVVSPSLTLPYSRLVIIGFTIVIVLAVKWLLTKTRFGLFVRAVTQNRQMARAIGVRSSRIDMLAFGLGSGLAGLAGCALSQIGNVGPDLGQNYIIDTFLVVVVGGVGQLLGAILAAFGLGIGGKFLEVAMGAVLAKICLLVLIILFIQKRPQGLFAVKGRFVE